MRARLAFLGLAWVAAFTIVVLLFVAFGEQLREMPLAARAFVISGVLVISMTQVVIPLIHRVLRRAAHLRAGDRLTAERPELPPQGA